MLSEAMIISTNKTLGSSSWPDVLKAVRSFVIPHDWPSLSSVEDVQELVYSNIKYERDRKDEWQKPDETILRGAGDCEDHSILKMAILRALGVRSSLLIVKLKRNHQAHAVCVIDNTWEVLDCRYSRILFDDEAGEKYDPLYLLGSDGNRIVLRTIDRSTG